MVISGYWRKAYRCHLNGFVYRLREDVYTWSNSLRYREGGCNVIHGTSGSPVLKAGTRTVVGIHNTTNDDGQECTLNNPCEVDRQGPRHGPPGSPLRRGDLVVHDLPVG